MIYMNYVNKNILEYFFAFFHKFGCNFSNFSDKKRIRRLIYILMIREREREKEEERSAILTGPFSA